MAIVRCKVCGINRDRAKAIYHIKPFRPINHPDSGLICGTKDCRNTGLVWLTENEVIMFKKGERIFAPATNTVKFMVEGMEE